MCTNTFRLDMLNILNLKSYEAYNNMAYIIYAFFFEKHVRAYFLHYILAQTKQKTNLTRKNDTSFHLNKKRRNWIYCEVRKFHHGDKIFFFHNISMRSNKRKYPAVKKLRIHF